MFDEELRQLSIKISNSIDAVVKYALEERLKVLGVDIERETERMKVAASHGDFKENSEYKSAVEAIASKTQELSDTAVSLDEFSRIREIGYVPTGRVTLYSTVKLEFSTEEDITKKRYISFKIFPNDISDISHGILAKNTPIGLAIWSRRIGDVVSVVDKSTGDPVKYRIVGIY